jgi:tripartite-type tricarboxylate transporter receptor subunit TctC
MKTTIRAATALAATLCIANALAQAPNYPTRAIRMIVPFAPGGGSDIVARLIGVELNKGLGQPVVIDNRAGAGSTLGTDLTAKAPPDGYTIVLNNIGLAFNATLYSKLPYDTLKDLAPISLVATQPNLFVVHPSLPVKSVAEFLKLARARPGQITYASGGVGSGSHLASELLILLTKVSLIHVPYKGTGPAVTDLLGGQVQMMVSTMASALPHAKAGKLRALGVTSAARSPAAPDVPTMIEAGVPGFEFTTWYAMLAPAGTPKPVIQKLNAELARISKLPEIADKFSTQGLDPLSSTPEAFGEYLKTEVDKWGKVVKATGARAE